MCWDPYVGVLWSVCSFQGLGGVGVLWPVGLYEGVKDCVRIHGLVFF